MACSIESATNGTSRNRLVWIILCSLALLAWIPTVQQSVQMPLIPGTMGMRPGAFLLFWTVMMVAMMLPAFAPILSFHLNVAGQQTPRPFIPVQIVLILSGYLCIWLLFGLPVFLLAQFGAYLAYSAPQNAIYFGMALLLFAGLYQLTPLAAYCLACCNPKLMTHSHTHKETNHHKYSPVHDLHSGVLHGLSCLGTCGGLMLILIPFGLMSLFWMIVITLIIFCEKVWQHGKTLSYLVASGLIFLSFLAWAIPSLLPGLHLG